MPQDTVSVREEWIACCVEGDAWTVLPPKRIAVVGGMRAEDWERQHRFLTTRNGEGMAGRHGTVRVVDLRALADTQTQGDEEEA